MAKDWKVELQQLMADLLATGRGTLAPLGNFEVVLKGARTGRDPSTGAPVTIPAANVLRFISLPEGASALTSNAAGKQSLSLEGFGLVMVQSYEAYEGRNPQTGERILVPAAHELVFRPDPSLREKIAAAPPVEREGEGDEAD